MKNYRISLKVISIVAIIWAVCEIALCIWSHRVSVDLGGIDEDILLAYDIYQIVVYLIVMLSGIMGVITSRNNSVWKIGVVVGGISLFICIVIPLITKVPFNIVAIIVSIMISLGSYQVHSKYEC